MAKFALYGELTAKPGKEPEVEAFLKQGGEMAQAEPGTVHWYAIKEDRPASTASSTPSTAKPPVTRTSTAKSPKPS